MPHAHDGDLALVEQLIKLLSLVLYEGKIRNQEIILQIAVKPLSQSDPKKYFRPDLDLNTLRRWVYPITGEVTVCWKGTKVVLKCQDWQIELKRTPDNMNIPCCELAIAVLNECIDEGRALSTICND